MGLLSNYFNVSIRRQRIKRNNLCRYSRIPNLWTWYRKNIKHRDDKDLYYYVKLPCINFYSCHILGVIVMGLGAADTNTNNGMSLDLHNMRVYIFYCFISFVISFYLFLSSAVFDILSFSLVFFSLFFIFALF